MVLHYDPDCRTIQSVFECLERIKSWHAARHVKSAGMQTCSTLTPLKHLKQLRPGGHTLKLLLA